MADKSPRQHMAKKPTKSIKEKRAEKREAASKNGASPMANVSSKKR